MIHQLFIFIREMAMVTQRSLRLLLAGLLEVVEDTHESAKAEDHEAEGAVTLHGSLQLALFWVCLCLCLCFF